MLNAQDLLFINYTFYFQRPYVPVVFAKIWRY